MTAVSGTTVVIFFELTTVNGTLTPFENVTLFAPKKPVPEIVSAVPAKPLEDESPVIVGTTWNCVPTSVPLGTVTVSVPSVSSLGTVATICVFDFTENDGEGTPPMATCVAPVKPKPLIVSFVPTGAATGLKFAMYG